MVNAIIVLAVSGLAFGALLGYAAKRFAVQVDPRSERIREVLPGANCGACGYPGCGGLADAIAAGRAPIDSCPVGKAATAKAIAEIMGTDFVDCGPQERAVPRILCAGGLGISQDRFRYDGPKDCKAATSLQGGPKSCEYGCVGLGTCARACPFGAISMGRDGLPVVDLSKCTSCGKCVDSCPRGIIKLLPENAVHVKCSSLDAGPAVRKICKAGCIACRACEKVCKEGAIAVRSNLASIDPAKCTMCGGCQGRCPVKCVAGEGRGEARKAS